MRKHERLPPRSALVAEGAVAAALFALLAVGFLWPLPRLLSRHLGPGLGDPLFNLVILKWDMDQLRLGLPDLWNPPFFHPTEGVLALSDHLLGPAVVALGLTELGASPVAAYNLLLLASFAGCALAAHAVLRAAGLGRTAAFAGGVVYAFSPWRLSQTPHLQVLLAAFVPLVLWSFDRLLARPGWRRAALFLAVYAAHMSGGTYLAYMIHLPMAVLVLHRVLRGGGAYWRRPAPLAVAAALALAVAAAVFLPYRLHAVGGLERSVLDFKRYGATLPALVTPSHWSWSFPLVAEPLERLLPAYEPWLWHAEKNLFPGLVPALLFLSGAGLLWRRRGIRRGGPSPHRKAILWLCVLAAAAFVATDVYTWAVPLEAGVPFDPGEIYDWGLGVIAAALLAAWLLHRRRTPAAETTEVPEDERLAWRRGLLWTSTVSLLLAFPVFFEPLSDLLPGMANMRVPARFYVFASLGVALLAAIGLEALLARLPGRLPGRLRPALAAAVLALLLLDLAPAERLPWQRLPLEPGFPAVHHWLAGRTDVAAYLELPFDSRLEHETIPMYWNTLHWLPLANGYSGHHPPAYVELRRLCCSPVPDARALAYLRRIGVSHLVVRVPEIERRGGPVRAYRQWREDVLAGRVPGVREIYADDARDRVYSLIP